jgi:hypothetical protein
MPAFQSLLLKVLDKYINLSKNILLMKKITSFKQYTKDLSIPNEPIKLELVDGDWEIEQVIDITTVPPVDESVIINPHLHVDSVKRGDFIYITAVLNKAGTRVTPNSIGVIKARVVNIYNSIQALNQINK